GVARATEAGSPAVGSIQPFQVPLHAWPVAGAHPDLTQDKALLPPPLALGALAARGGIAGRTAHRLQSSRLGASSDCACRCGSAPSFSLISCCNLPTAARKEGRWLFTISHI